VKISLAVFAIVYLLGSCVPNTSTVPPDTHLPPTYPVASGVTSTSLAATPWQSLYPDPVLQDLVAKALAKNLTAQAAYATVLAAQQNVIITRANELPALQASLQTPYQITVGDKTALTPTTAFAPELDLAASYQVDFFGRLRSATDVTRAQALATQAGYETVLWTLVSQVASAYFQLRELDAVGELTRQTAKLRAESLRLMKLRVQYGESSLQDQRQAEESLLSVTKALPQIEQSIKQTENTLSILDGEYPHDIPRGLPLKELITLPLVPPAGVPSELLQRRPDIVQSEATLVAADAQIDVARKLLYPSISLGASAGVSGQVATGVASGLPKLLSDKVNGVFFGPIGVFSILPQVTQLIFNGGAPKARIKAAQAQQQQAAYSYVNTVLEAFEEVANGIVAYDDQRLTRVQDQLYELASLDSTRLAHLRFDEGQTSYLEVLDAESRSYQAQVDTEQALLNERLALVQLYLALGGGWQKTAAKPLPAPSPSGSL
jgi:multidrug efflux system outer membrane protein